MENSTKKLAALTPPTRLSPTPPPTPQSSPNWKCFHCQREDGYPLLHVPCGHTVCEYCIDFLNRCPICEHAFDPLLCTDNFTLMSGKTKPRMIISKPLPRLNLIYDSSSSDDENNLDMTETTTNKPDKIVNTHLQHRQHRRYILAAVYIKHSVQQTLQLLEKSLLDKPSENKFTFSLIADDIFCAGLVTKIVNCLRLKLEPYEMEVAIETVSLDKKTIHGEYINNINIYLPYRL